MRPTCQTKRKFTCTAPTLLLLDRMALTLLRVYIPSRLYKRRLRRRRRKRNRRIGPFLAALIQSLLKNLLSSPVSQTRRGCLPGRPSVKLRMSRIGTTTEEGTYCRHQVGGEEVVR
uniref:Uncharacterized protein n=1 Tax=Setaria viridis TaxID=4556 RepID=A0A4U6U6P4_SETVI|nr:hypothetical protein SEVIR_6G091650v2 [Setaria viridis]